MSEILARGGVAAVESALEGFAGQASEDELEEAVDLACRVISDDTARIGAHADQQGARVRELEQQIDMLLDTTIREILEQRNTGP
ncbi:hypothetical protein [Streptomyces sp. WM6378]|uniref:hypothetical protein n=1 Tax=Streptomyces sp. WM6378 TaxID=1415557 RepID=UPI0006AE1527|nr:hypothetical protein [Streptomyces sp. WM6378]KOU54209.1 hypothetical protein ADK54_02335 [Streptomyces sp. WM6378]